MGGWTKLFQSILTSSIWCEDHVVVRVWIAMLAGCDAMGIVEGSIPGFANVARVLPEELIRALTILESPDPHSRTQDNEGRRIESIPGGWKILNYVAYRDRGQGKEGSRAPYFRKYRATKKGCAQPDDVARNTEVEVEGEGEELGKARLGTASPSEFSGSKTTPGWVKLSIPDRVRYVIALWNAICVEGSPFKPVRECDVASLIPLVEACLADPGWLARYIVFLAGIPDDPFYRGEVAPSGDYKKPFVVRFKWVVSYPSVVYKHADLLEDKVRERQEASKTKTRRGEARRAPSASSGVGPRPTSKDRTDPTHENQAHQVREAMERKKRARAAAKDVDGGAIQ